MSSQPDTRQSLLLRLRDADNQQAWSEFFEIYQPLVYRLARSRGLQDAEANDITQEVMLAVSKAIDRYEPRLEEGSFRAWLARITRNITLNRLRYSASAPLGGKRDAIELDELAHDAGDDPAARQEFENEHRRQVFLWAAEQLKDRFSGRNWQAFWMTCVEGSSAAEVAEQLGMSTGAVYVARCRVIARLREIVELKTEII